MRCKRVVPLLLAAFLAIGILVLPATASAETYPFQGAMTADSPAEGTFTTSTVNCPSGKCFTEDAEWVPGTTIITSGGSGSGSATGGGSSTSFVKETPVSKLKEIKRSFEKKYKVVVGYYQNPDGYQGSAGCIDPTKVKRWDFHAGEFYKTTNHLRQPVPPARWQKGDRICGWKEVKINGRRWVTGTQEDCANVKSWIPITTRIRKPKKVYVQYPTEEKFFEIAIKRLEIKSESQGGSGSGSGEGGSTVVETPGHWTCKPGGQLIGNKCRYCPPPQCEEKEPPCEYECVPDEKPQIQCVWPPHVYEYGGNQQIWCKAMDPNGDLMTVTMEGDSHAEISSVVERDEWVDGGPCPSGFTCYRGTLWGLEAGTAHLVAEVKAGGKFDRQEHNLEVREYNFES